MGDVYNEGTIMSDVITVVADLKAKPGKEEALRNAALALVEPTRKEQGCIQYDLHAHLTDPGRVVFYENWATVEDLNRHGQSPHLKAFGAMAADLVESRSVERFRRIA
jgi:quinol monooxygenase YgiN